MLDHIPIENILFIDIETVPALPAFEDLPEQFKKHWDRKTRFQRKEGDTLESFYEKAGIYAEFGKIVCISVGKFRKEDKLYLRLKSFYGDDEKQLLEGFIELLNSLHKDVFLCAHNGKEFDFPYLSRRILLNSLKLPEQLDCAGKKPWEVNFMDTLELWKFGDYKNYTSLDLLAAIFRIPTPKDDIDGSEVAGVYWNERDVERIRTYCQKDVVTVARLLQRFKGEEMIPDEHIVFV